MLLNIPMGPRFLSHCPHNRQLLVPEVNNKSYVENLDVNHPFTLSSEN